ncbi:MAG TPA: acyl-CoA dehydratase activase-related protein, partial [Steroidobacteraceae bacterium]|nr:acyl-CoA dehydratase activase-related protein [Steroidobacteraceae bacterium]
LIPPSPELLGALGVALLALARRDGVLKPPPGCEHSAQEGSPQPEPALSRTTDLLTLAAPEMKPVGRVTCQACKLYCSIDRFEVAGRRFPFGGRCSLFENVWKRKSRSVAAPDLVQQRTEILFGRSSTEPPASATRIGIPRALTTHSLFPLYSGFFSSLGIEVVLSDVDPGGELKSYSGFCFPAQIAHGAVMDLARRGVDWVFLPHVVRMPQPDTCRDSYLCPITQAAPYFLAKAFPAVHLLSPALDFTRGYETSAALAETVVRELGIPRTAADQAWAAAVHAQKDAERALSDLGQRALDQAVAAGRPAILLAGHSYNAFTPEASQSVGKKLSSMGVPVIPADCLAPVEDGRTAWHFANQILNAAALAKRHPNLFLLCVSNFSCTIDAFTQAMIASEMGAKPYLILEIDAHTADAGVQTRLEAFLDIAHSYREAQASRGQSFTPCRLDVGGRVIRSNGEQVPISDPRVRMYFPNFSQYHAQALAMATGWLGLHAGEVIMLDRSQLDRGLQYTSGRECLPLPICIGQLLQIHENRAPGEIAGFYMIPGGAPCVSESYKGYIEQFIADQRLPDLFLLSFQAQDGSIESDQTSFARCLGVAILTADILLEIDHVLRVVGAPGSVDSLREEWQRFTVVTRSLDKFHAELPAFVDRLAALPRTRDPLACPRVVVAGDFFTRFSPFFMEGIDDLYAEQGIILKPVDLSDLLLYLDYYRVAETANEWGMKPGALALGKACTRVLQPDGKQYLQNWLAYQTQRLFEDHYRGLFRKTGLLVAEPNDVSSSFAQASEHVSHLIYGEITPTVGKGLDADKEGYDGIIVIGPFNCLPYRISEAILKPLSVQRGMPILTYESDGYAVSPSVLRQVDVHVQQVLDHAAGKREPSLVASSGLAGILTAAVRKIA